MLKRQHYFEIADIDIIVITESNKAHFALCAVYRYGLLACRPTPSPPTNAKLVPRRTPTYSPFSDVLGNSLIKTHDRKRVKYSTQRYCTAVANRRYCIDGN